MFFKELKNIEDLTTNDIIFHSIDKYSKNAVKVSDKLLKILKESEIREIPVVKSNMDQREIIEKVNNELLDDELLALREILLKETKDLYTPFSEDEKSFIAKSNIKHKIIKRDELLQEEIHSSLLNLIRDASSQIFPNFKQIKLLNIIKDIHKYFNLKKVRNFDNLNDKKVLEKLYLFSIRRNYRIRHSRVENDGDSILLHAVDTTIHYILAITSMNKLRALRDAPRSTAKYFIANENIDIHSEFFYPEDIVAQAALGVLLHPLGFMHKSLIFKINEIQKEFKSNEDSDKLKELIDLFKTNINVVRNLFRFRDDVSAITKMIINYQKTYPDIIKDSESNKFIHELIRIFHIVDSYDESIYPFLHKNSITRLNAIEYLKSNSSYYKYTKSKIIKNKRFDEKMLREFLNITAPFDYQQIVYGFKAFEKQPRLKLAIHTYKENVLPIFCLLRDYESDINYKYGSVFIDFSKDLLLLMQEDGSLKALSFKENFFEDLVIKEMINSKREDKVDYRDPIFD